VSAKVSAKVSQESDSQSLQAKLYRLSFHFSIGTLTERFRTFHNKDSFWTRWRREANAGPDLRGQAEDSRHEAPQRLRCGQLSRQQRDEGRGQESRGQEGRRLSCARLREACGD
jgi:hypothetical protein